MSRFFLTFLLPFVIAFYDANARNIQNPLIQEACKNSSDQILCVNLLRSDPTSQNSDLKGLAIIAMKHVEATAAATSLSMKVSLDNPEIDKEPGVEDAINDCLQHYLSLVELVEDSINAVASDSPREAKHLAAAALDDAETCDAGVKEVGGSAAQVAQRNQDLLKLFHNAISVLRVSQSSHH